MNYYEITAGLQNLNFKNYSNTKKIIAAETLDEALAYARTEAQDIYRHFSNAGYLPTKNYCEREIESENRIPFHLEINRRYEQYVEQNIYYNAIPFIPTRKKTLVTKISDNKQVIIFDTK